MSRDWITKPVNFKKTNQEHMQLYEIAGSLPNFSAAVLDLLRSIRDGGRPVPTWSVPDATPTYEFISHQTEPEDDDGQFLV